VALLVLGCTSGGGSTFAGLIGLNDLVLVDDLPTNGAVASEPPIPDGGTSPQTPDPVAQGVPNRYLFLTSTDTNELKILNLYKPGYLGRAFELAPNPLETLAISVLSRPSVLACDEGLSADGRRVTGPFVYATRRGGAQLSVVDATSSGFIQVTSAPLATPAPVTAIVGWMGDHLTAIPATTDVYYATWDGQLASLYVLTLPTDRARRGEVKAARPRHLIDFGPEAVVAMQVLPALASRTLDGIPFCAGPAACLAIATRANRGAGGRTLLLELDTLRAAPMAFPAPVREFSTSGAAVRLYGILDEEGCTDLVCGGVIGVDTTAGTSPQGFPVYRDFSGRSMAPLLFSGGLPRGMTMASWADRFPLPNTSPLSLVQALETVDSGVPSLRSALQGYLEVGLVSVSNGLIYPVDTSNGVGVDFDGNRTALGGGFLRIPRPDDDGGLTFIREDGGLNFEEVPASIDADAIPITPDGLATEPYRGYRVRPDGGSRASDAPSSITLADGYLLSQNITVVREGELSGLILVPSPSTDQDRVNFSIGLESRVLIGDRVDFGLRGVADGGVITSFCGSAAVVGVDPGSVRVAEAPPGCTTATRNFATISAGPAPQPLVVTGSVEGHMGRVADGQTLTYTRRFRARPARWNEPLLGADGGVIGATPPRPAFSMTMGTMPPERGAFWAFSINGNLTLYRISFDANSVGCPPYLPGRLKVAPAPKYVNDVSTSFPWTLLTLYPASNGVVFSPLLSLYDVTFGSVTASDGAICYR
jgi:hypothetical protein